MKTYFFLTLGFGLLAIILIERISLLGQFWILANGLSLWCWRVRLKRSKYRFFFMGLFYLISLVLATHLLPGFNNYQYLENFKFSENSAPFNMYMNLDKFSVGILLAIILGFGPGKMNIKSVKIIVLLTIICFFSLLGPALILNYIDWEPKFSLITVLWMFNNLFFVCLSEEFIFRRLIQQDIHDVLMRKTPYAKQLSLLLGSLIFGLAHLKGGPTYVFLASIAGVLYGLAYQKTERIEASMLVHFGVNSLHILLFTYPYTSV